MRDRDLGTDRRNNPSRRGPSGRGRARVRRVRPGRRTFAASLLAALLICALAAPTAGAVAPLSWSPPAAADGSGQPPSGISCPSQSLCVAVDRAGNALTSTDVSGSAPPWSATAIDPGQQLSAVSCASGSLCVAVDEGGNALASTNPTAGAWSRRSIDGGALTGVSCPTSSLCVAVDAAGNLLASTNPGSPFSAWSITGTDPGNKLQSVSCASTSLCVAVDAAGNALASSTPATGPWSRHPVDPPPVLSLTAVSCIAGACLAVDAGGSVLSSANPAAPAPTWSSTPVDPGTRLLAVSCAASGLCVAGDEHGRALASDNPSSPLPGWGETSAEPGVPLTGIACLASGICVALDAKGRSLTARVPPPQVATLAPAEVAESAATLSGSVNPNDASLTACWFELGATVSYGVVVPCASGVSASGGPQVVSAQVTELAPNTTYHYRLLAASAVGMSMGGDQTFTTAVSSAVQRVSPHPSIRGTPAVGQRLTCQTGIPSGTPVRVSYSWLRDLVPIPAANGSTYLVKGTDAGHHLQCQVTASNAGGSDTARSAFVTVPVQGVLAAAGETTVGRVRVSKTTAFVPVRCSPHAQAGCRVRLRLGLAGRTRVTLGLAAARLGPGRQATLSVSLNKPGRRLFKRRRSLAAQLTVSGTVIGVIESVLAQRRVVFGARAHGALTHARAHRG